MKKFVSGIIVGAFLFAGVSAFADSSSLIGQKVQGLFAVEKGGTKIADAVIINGSAYAPVRAVSQAAGVGLTVEGKTIKMSEEKNIISSELEATPSPVQPTPTKEPEKSSVTQLNVLNSKIMSLSATIAILEAQLRDDPNNAEIKVKLEDAKTQYNTFKNEFDKLKASAGL